MAAYPRRGRKSNPDFNSLRGELKAGTFKPVYVATDPTCSVCAR